MQDLTEVMNIWLETNIQAHDFIPESYWTGNFEMVKEMLPSAELFVYLNDSGAIEGFVGLSGGYIEGIFVRKPSQSKGIGKKLLDHIKEHNEQLALSVYQKNEGAARFYVREGFRIQSQKTDENTGENEFFMVWTH